MKTKSKKTKKKKAEDEFYFKLDNPVDFRRNLLFTIKGTITILKDYEKIKEITERKKEKINGFIELRNEINSLVYKVKQMLPYQINTHRKEKDVMEKLEKIKEEKPVIVKKQEPVPQPKPLVPKNKSEIELLEEELNKVEKELASLK